MKTDVHRMKMADFLESTRLTARVHRLVASPTCTASVSEVTLPAHECSPPRMLDLCVAALVEHYRGPAHYAIGTAPIRPTLLRERAPMVLLPAGVPSRWMVEGRVRLVVFAIAGTEMSRIFEELELPDATEGLLRIASGGCFSNMPLFDCVMRVWSYAQQAPGQSRLLMESNQILLANELGLMWTRQQGLPGHTLPSLPPRKLRVVLEYIDSRIADDIRLEDLAAMCGLSRFHFLRLFKAHTGFPPYRYVIKRRVEKAQFLLKDTEQSVLSIATGLGFADQNSLTRHFRRFLGVTPREYRGR